jgi:nitrite reductase/ring-hydroxylating ferredoxin subunit
MSLSDRIDPERLTEVAVYRRTVGASLERIWENVLDWEHLPWLHRTSFAAVELLELRADGWRVRLQLQPADGGPEAIVETHLEKDANRYLTLTSEGYGAGSEIWTRLAPESADETAIEVRFLLPDISADAVEVLGAGYAELYAQLWDEDEIMMQRRQDLLTERPPRVVNPGRVELGSLEEVRARQPLLVEYAGRRFRIIEVGGELVVHATVCPHQLGPLDAAPVEGAAVRCPWHGYRFDVRSGRSCDGHSFALGKAPRLRIDSDSGSVSLAAD